MGDSSTLCVALAVQAGFSQAKFTEQLGHVVDLWASNATVRTIGASCKFWDAACHAYASPPHHTLKTNNRQS
jgi:hypothetical protein